MTMTNATLTEVDNGRDITVCQGDAVDIALAENATTGFRWQVVRSDGFTEEHPPVADAPPPANPPFGAPGMRLFRFRATDIGPGRIELKHWREFEGDASVTKRFAVSAEIIMR